MDTETNQAAEQQIRDLTRKWNEASLGMDLKAIDSLYSNDCIFQFQNGQLADKKWVMNLLASGSIKFESIDNEDERIRIYGNAALWTSRTALVETYNNARPPGKYLWLRLWSFSEGKWQIVAFQSTTVPS